MGDPGSKATYSIAHLIRDAADFSKWMVCAGHLRSAVEGVWFSASGLVQ